MRRSASIFLAPMLLLSTSDLSAQSGQPAPKSPAVIFSRLEDVVRKTSEVGWSPVETAQLKVIRGDFAANGDVACRFLISKLDGMTQSEGRLAATSGDGRSTAVQMEAARSAPLKFEVFIILSEIYPSCSAQTQHRMLQALSGSYTPVVAGDTHGGRPLLNWVFLRIGKDSVDALLGLSISRDVSVRCGAIDALDFISDEMAKNTAGLSRAPALSCHDSDKANARAVDLWRTWWRNNRKLGAFPNIPDVYGGNADVPMP
jgi:hypothetical protein